jgi:hypothetical protein
MRAFCHVAYDAALIPLVARASSLAGVTLGVPFPAW